MSRSKGALPNSVVTALCVEASVCPQTVRKYMRGGTLLPMTQKRLEQALKKRGIPLVATLESHDPS